jgi:predicted PurR-regulated permease PerM
VYQWLRSLLGNRPSVAALLTLGMILVIVILPLSVVSIAVVHEAAAFSKRLETGEINVQEPLQALTRLFTDVTQYLDQFGVDTQQLPQRLTEAALTVSRALGAQVLQIG